MITVGSIETTTGGLLQEPPVVGSYYRRLSSRTVGSTHVPINSRPSPPKNLSPGGFIFGAVVLPKFRTAALPAPPLPAPPPADLVLPADDRRGHPDAPAPLLPPNDRAGHPPPPNP